MEAMRQSSSLFSTNSSLTTGTIMFMYSMVKKLMTLKPYLIIAITFLFKYIVKIKNKKSPITYIFKQILPFKNNNLILESAIYLFKHVFDIHNKKLTLVIKPYVGLVRNEIYEASDVYLGNLISPNIDILKVGKIPKQTNFSLTIEKDQEVDDNFKNCELTWKIVSKPFTSQNDNKTIWKIVYELSFDKKNKDMVMNEYLPHVLSEVKKINESNKSVKLFTKSFSSSDGRGHRGVWSCVDLDHPATFDTLAMDSDLKVSIIQDLDKFLKRREFYRSVGKAWKRGYLLYGPPGTGKSSLIAAIANYLKFDVYDIELTNVDSDSQLRHMLLSTSNKSIIVIEDIDCSANFHKRVSSKKTTEPNNLSLTEANLSLTGMLNFTDGLWSSCGEELIIIFTTNHKDKIDPALLRPGRMDMHIHMTYCSYESFRILTSRYFGEFDNHELLEEIEGLIEVVQVTPAEIAEELMRTEDLDLALKGVVNLLNLKKAAVTEDNEKV